MRHTVYALCSNQAINIWLLPQASGVWSLWTHFWTATNFPRVQIESPEVDLKHELHSVSAWGLIGRGVWGAIRHTLYKQEVSMQTATQWIFCGRGQWLVWRWELCFSSSFHEISKTFIVLDTCSLDSKGFCGFLGCPGPWLVTERSGCILGERSYVTKMERIIVVCVKSIKVFFRIMEATQTYGELVMQSYGVLTPH